MPLPSRTRLWLLVALSLAVGAMVWLRPSVGEASSAASDAAIRNAVNGILNNAAMPSALWGVWVQNLQTGEVVVSRNADLNMVPASNLKLVTTATALSAFGPHHRFVTRLHFDGEAADSALVGDLVIRGSGDPTFGSALSGEDPLEQWARELHRLGVRRIVGRILGDDDALDEAPYAAGWDIDYIAVEDWAAGAGGLSYADNLVNIGIAGTRAGEAAAVTADPAGYVSLDADVMTRRGRGYGPLRIRRAVGTNDISVEGRVSAAYRGTARIPIQDPTAFTLTAFAAALRDAGIAVDARLVDADDLEGGFVYNADPVLVHLSPPLIEILETINEKSNNFYAEQVFRVVGRGTTRGGALRVQSFMERVGLPADGLSMRDGSGLSRKNLVQPEALGRLLAHLYRSPLRDDFLATLPQGGDPETTLRYRLGGLPVRAKTGALEHVRALSGYVAGPGETPYAFVLFANNFTTSSSLISVAQNEVVEAIATGGAR